MSAPSELQRRKEVVDVYRRVTDIVWQRLSPTFGNRTINAIARNVIARQAKTHPHLGAIHVGDDGLLWDGLGQHLGQVPLDELRTMLDEFIDEFFDALSTLIGKLVVGKIFKEAEEQVTNKEKRP